MTKPPSRSPVFRLPRERRVADILRAARKVFEDKGYEAALISEIAERAHVVEGTIYRYFENKRALLTKVVEHWYAGMLFDYDQELRHIRGSRNRLRFLIWKHLLTVHEEPALCRLVFQVLRVSDGYRATEVFTLNSAYTRRTIELIKEGQESGEFSSDLPPRLVRDMIYGAVEHHTWAYLRGEGDFSPDDAAEAITELVYRGLANPVPAARQRDDGLAVRLAKATRRLERMAAERTGSLS
jgi:TetR/AcrR family transcriptional regulator, fatty acid metabolism regulator protein